VYHKCCFHEQRLADLVANKLTLRSILAVLGITHDIGAVKRGRGYWVFELGAGMTALPMQEINFFN
jgi:hypothetical protein